MKTNTVLNNIIETGKFCKVTFVKKDGSLRTLHGRTGVSKYTKGGTRTTKDSDYIMFWDREVGYRNINRKTIVAVNGINLEIKGGN